MLLALVLALCSAVGRTSPAGAPRGPQAPAATGSSEGHDCAAAGTCAADDAWRAERAAVHGRVPVVFMHWTMAHCSHCEPLPAFLPWAVRAAVAAGNHVVLVGDEPTRELQGASVTWIPVAALGSATRALDEVYQHASSNAESYEKGCMQRPFLLLALVRLLRVERILHLDSDVLLLVSVERWLHRLEREKQGGAGGEAGLPGNQISGLWLRPRQTYQSWHWVESIATAVLSAQVCARGVC